MCKSKDRQNNGQEKKYKQRYTKHYTENLRLSNTNTIKNQGEHKCSGRVGSSCATSGRSRVTLVTSLLIWCTDVPYRYSFCKNNSINEQRSIILRRNTILFKRCHDVFAFRVINMKVIYYDVSR